MANRTKVISTKVTEAEFIAVKNQAANLGLKVAPYAHRVLIQALTLAPDSRFLAAELLAFEETFLALIVASLRGDSLNDASVAQLRSRFDSIKDALVERALQRRSQSQKGSQTA
jgi:hypothetical protein